MRLHGYTKCKQQLWTKHLSWFVFIFCLQAISIVKGCDTIPLSIDTFDSCIGDTCLVKHSVSGVVSTKSPKFCFQMVNPIDGTQITTVEMGIIRSVARHSLTNCYYTDDPAVDCPRTCGCTAGSAGTCAAGKPLPKFRDLQLSFEGRHVDSECFISNGAHPPYYCLNCGFSFQDRYRICKVEPQAVVETHLVINAFNMSKSVTLTGNPMSTIELGDNISIKVQSHVRESAYFPFTLYDLSNMGDFYLLQNDVVNSITESLPTKIGWYKRSRTSGLKFPFEVNMHSCHKGVYDISGGPLSIENFLNNNTNYRAARIAKGAEIITKHMVSKPRAQEIDHSFDEWEYSLGAPLVYVPSTDGVQRISSYGVHDTEYTTVSNEVYNPTPCMYSPAKPCAISTYSGWHKYGVTSVLKTFGLSNTSYPFGSSNHFIISHLDSKNVSGVEYNFVTVHWVRAHDNLGVPVSVLPGITHPVGTKMRLVPARAYAMFLDDEQTRTEAGKEAACNLMPLCRLVNKNQTYYEFAVNAFKWPSFEPGFVVNGDEAHNSQMRFVDLNYDESISEAIYFPPKTEAITFTLEMNNVQTKMLSTSSYISNLDCQQDRDAIKCFADVTPKTSKCSVSFLPSIAQASSFVDGVNKYPIEISGKSIVTANVYCTRKAVSTTFKFDYVVPDYNLTVIHTSALNISPATTVNNGVGLNVDSVSDFFSLIPTGLKGVYHTIVNVIIWTIIVSLLILSLVVIWKYARNMKYFRKKYKLRML